MSSRILRQYRLKRWIVLWHYKYTTYIMLMAAIIAPLNILSFAVILFYKTLPSPSDFIDSKTTSSYLEEKSMPECIQHQHKTTYIYQNLQK